LRIREVAFVVMGIARTFILRQRSKLDNSPGRNFLLAGGDKNNLRDIVFFAIIRIGMKQSRWLLGSKKSIQAGIPERESALSFLFTQNHIGENDDSKTH
jgi:hypothetical protein